jgi:hypothetical protein
VFVLLSFWPLFVLRFTVYDCPYLQAVHNGESDQFIVSRECVAASFYIHTQKCEIIDKSRKYSLQTTILNKPLLLEAATHSLETIN